MNAPKQITVEVTQKDLDDGVRFDAGNCPLAKAWKRELPKHFPKGTVVKVGIAHVFVHNADGDLLAQYQHTKKSALFIDSVDNKDRGQCCTGEGQKLIEPKPGRFQFRHV